MPFPVCDEADFYAASLSKRALIDLSLSLYPITQKVPVKPLTGISWLAAFGIMAIASA
jgi:hypothetical protein